MQRSGLPPRPSPPWAGPPASPDPRVQPRAPAPRAAASSSGVAGSGMGPTAELERNLRFLQAQHAETLHQLHREVEQLRRQNRDLHYKLIMYPVLQKAEFSPSTSPAKSTPRGSTVGHRTTGGSSEAEEEPSTGGPAFSHSSLDRSVVLEQPERNSESPKEHPEGEDTQQRQEEVGTGAEPKGEPPSPKAPEGPTTEVPHRGVEPPAKPFSRGRPAGTPHRAPRGSRACDRATSPIRFPSASHDLSKDVRIPAASSNPFLVNVLPSHMRKPPTLEECEVVIRQLWNINHMQMQELMYLRSCLEDIHKTRRMPEEYMLTGQLGKWESSRLPRITNAAKTWILTPLPAAERAVLPALKQTLGNSFAERQKRTQAIQRKRLRRMAL